MSKYRLFLAVLMLASLAYMVACSSTQSHPEEPLQLKLHVLQWGSHVIKRAAVVVHNSNGTPIDYKIFDHPSEESYDISFANVPDNGYISVLTSSDRHINYPVENDYDYSLIYTYPVSFVRRKGGTLFVSYDFAGLDVIRFRSTSIQISGPCPDNAYGLSGYFVNTATGGYYVTGRQCVDGSVNEKFWVVKQNNGKSSIVLWPAKVQYAKTISDFLTPLRYVKFIDVDPNSAHAFTSNDYSSDVGTASININNLPDNSSVTYTVDGVKGGALIFGLSAYSVQTNGVDQVKYAQVLDELDALMQIVTIRVGGARVRRFKTIGNSLPQSDTWSISDFMTIPNPDNINVSYNGSQVILYSPEFGNGNKYLKYGVRSVSSGNNATYRTWHAYVGVDTSAHKAEFSFPILPTSLSAYAPSISSSDFLSAFINGYDYDYYSLPLSGSGNYRHAFRVIKDNITSSLSSTMLDRSAEYPCDFASTIPLYDTGRCYP